MIISSQFIEPLSKKFPPLFIRMDEKISPKCANSGLNTTSKILRALFGGDEQSRFSSHKNVVERLSNSIDVEEDPKKMNVQIDTTLANNWRLIEERLQEFTIANEQLASLFSYIRHGLMEITKARTNLENGTYEANSQQSVDCNRYIEELEQWLKPYLEQLPGIDHSCVQAYESTKFVADQQMSLILTKTRDWRQAQRRAILGGPADQILSELNLLASGFDRLEKALDSFSHLISQYSINIRDMSQWCDCSPSTLALHKERANVCVQMQSYIKQRRYSLVQRSFVVFEQPPSIVRRSAAPDISKTQKNSKVPFDLELRALAGDTFGLRGSSVEVEVLLITEKQAQEIAKKTLDPLQEKLATPGLLLAPRVILQAQSDGPMSAVFRTVRVQSMNKRNDEDSDDMYHVLFRTKPFQTATTQASSEQASSPQPQQQPRFWVISLPFAVLSNAHRQDKYTRARMFWQLSFKVNDETSLATLTHAGKDGNEIRWQDFFPALDLWFRNTTRCREGLNAHWQYIAEKLMIANTDSLVTWDAFYKRKVGEAQLSFWDWFCPIADYLTKMPAYWNSGLILGFASRQMATHLLSQATLPSMLLRFSETKPGKMVVSYVIPRGGPNEESEIEHVLFDEKENKALEGKTLAECIRLSQDLQPIQYILPGSKPILELFALDAINSPQEDIVHKKGFGYVKPRVALVWRRDPPVPPDCLLNRSLDSPASYIYDPTAPNRPASHTSECLSDVEFRAAAEDFESYILSEEMAVDQEPSSSSYGSHPETLWHTEPLKAGKHRLLYGVHPDFSAVAIVGLGKRGAGFDAQELIHQGREDTRVATGAAVSALRGVGIRSISVDPCAYPDAAAEGAVLALHSYDDLKSNEDSKKPKVDLQVLKGEDDESIVESLWNRGTILGESQNLMRRLQEIPANLCTPTIFGQIAVDTLKNFKNVEVIVRDKKWAEDKKMFSFLSVSQGSDQPPKFVEMHLKSSKKTSNPPVVIVGKGVCFDSGGISLKPSANMDKMRSDMGGAACVLSTIYALARLGVDLPFDLIGLTPMVENLPGGKATKPGDVFYAMNGKSIKVDNTDSEGRLILADALCYADTFKPAHVIDVATLTGAMHVALGAAATGVFSTSDALWQKIYNASVETGDRVWRMPLFKTFGARLKNEAADLTNMALGAGGGSAVAALFLKEFVECSSWAHIDISAGRITKIYPGEGRPEERDASRCAPYTTRAPVAPAPSAHAHYAPTHVPSRVYARIYIDYT